MLQKLYSRKLILTIVAIFYTVTANLDQATKVRYASFITVGYALAQGIADAFGSGSAPSQGA